MNVSAVHKTHAKQNKWPVESLIAENIMFPSANANCQIFHMSVNQYILVGVQKSTVEIWYTSVLTHQGMDVGVEPPHKNTVIINHLQVTKKVSYFL